MRPTKRACCLPQLRRGFRWRWRPPSAGIATSDQRDARLESIALERRRRSKICRSFSALPQIKLLRRRARLLVVVALDKEASQTHDYCVTKNATLRAARPDPSLRKECLLGMTSQAVPRPHMKGRNHMQPTGVLEKSAKTTNPLK